MNWYLEVLRKYATFSGRARRKEYWMFFLFNIIIAVVLGFLDGMMGLAQQGGVGILSGLYCLAVLIPGLAVSVRRLHDTDKSGWWVFIALVPIIGALWLLWLMIKEGDTGTNQYGPSPKASSMGEPAMAV